MTFSIDVVLSAAIVLGQFPYNCRKTTTMELTWIGVELTKYEYSLSEEIPDRAYSRILQDVDMVVRPRALPNASYTPELLMGKAIQSGLALHTAVAPEI